MNCYNFAKKHKIAICIVVIHLLNCTLSTDLDNDNCNYVHNYGCYTSVNHVSTTTDRNILRSDDACSIYNLTNDIKYTPKVAKNLKSSLGIITVDFTLPNNECNYEVSLLVNSSITNNEDCKNHNFHNDNAHEDQIHTAKRNVCVRFDTSSHEHNCEPRTFTMWYSHVFTGCYALHFTSNGYSNVVLGNQYIKTNYIRTEVTAPKYRCYYEDWLEEGISHEEQMTFSLSISVHLGTAGMILTLMPMSFPEESNENACVLYSKQDLYTLTIETDENASSTPKNCSLRTVQLENETYTRDIECSAVLTVPRDKDYCLKIELTDERCDKQTVWNPPPHGGSVTPACVWLQSCTRMIKNSSIESTDTSGAMLIPTASTITGLTIIFLVFMIMLLACRRRMRRRMLIYGNTNLSDLDVAISGNQENESVETTDDEITPKSSIIRNIYKTENEPIILLYARGGTSFMNLMADFRKILSVHCGCRVRDWYDPDEWDEVASIGPSAWVVQLLRQEHRAIWIDSNRARDLLNSQCRKNGFQDAKQHKGTENEIGDFRDADLPTVVDIVKRSTTAQEYNKHFVVRLEGFSENAGREVEDPFDDLSPHTRYLIPHHLADLCMHLSRCPLNIDEKRMLKMEEMRLREQLATIRKSSQNFEDLF